MKHLWTDDDDETLGQLKASGVTWRSIGFRLGRTHYACMNRWNRLRHTRKARFTVPPEHRGWYEKLRRHHSLAFARAELERVLAQS